MNSPIRFHLVRHGEVEEKYQRVFGGRIDMGLSPQGHAQVQTLANYLRRIPLDAIYSCPFCWICRCAKWPASILITPASQPLIAALAKLKLIC